MSMSETIRHTYGDKDGKRSHDDAHSDPERHQHYNVPVDDEGKEIIPAGTFDPVYEAKARVLNRAVSRACEVG